MFCRALLRAFAIVAIIGINAAHAQTKLLPIRPVIQQTATWCWLATGEMIFRYYGVPANHPTNFQCGEARFQGATLTGNPAIPVMGPCWANCQPCAGQSAGSVQGILNMLTQYPAAMRLVTGNPASVVLQQPQATGRVSAAVIRTEIDAGRPMVAGITPGGPALPPGLSEHAVLIVGYSQGGGVIVVNDPFPYQYVGMIPPYLGAGGASTGIPGQFSLSLAAFASPMNWNTTVLHITP